MRAEWPRLSRNSVAVALVTVATAAGFVLCGRLMLGPSGDLLGGMTILVGMALGSRASVPQAIRELGATELGPDARPELQAEAARLAARAGLAQPPRLWLLHRLDIGAVAAGTSTNSAIGIADCLLDLPHRQLAGILAHETAHIAKRDLELFTMAHGAGIFARALAPVGALVAAVLMVVGSSAAYWAATAGLCFATFGVSLLQLALSRQREFEADAMAVRLTDDATGLAAVLQHHQEERYPLWHRVLGERPVPLLLRTHPPLQDRVARLLQSAGT